MDAKLKEILNNNEQISSTFSHIICDFTEDEVKKNLKYDLFYFLIIILFMENDFSPISEDMYKDNVLISSELLKSWKGQENTLETIIYLKNFNSKIKLIFTPIGNLILINVILKDINSDTYTVCVPIDKYVLLSLSEDLSKVFQNVEHISKILKNNIVCPVKSAILTSFGYPSGSFIGLPPEVIRKILFKLNILDIVHLCKTSKRLNCLINDNNIWHDLFKRDFKHSYEIKLKKKACQNVDWKVAYRNEYNIEDFLKFTVWSYMASQC